MARSPERGPRAQDGDGLGRGRRDGRVIGDLRIRSRSRSRSRLRSRSRPREPKRRRMSNNAGRSTSPDKERKRRRHSSSHQQREKGKERRRRTTTMTTPTTTATTRITDGGVAEQPLPYEARRLVKDDLRALEPLFVHYLWVQKRKDAHRMDEREFRGRWKSFMGKWNRNELAEGWYDPEMVDRISAMSPDEEDEDEGEREQVAPRRVSPMHQGDGNDDSSSDDNDHDREDHNHDRDDHDDNENDQDEDEDYGPTLPQQPNNPQRRRMGAGIPTFQDLSLRDELLQEDREAERRQLREARKADRALQKERLEDLAPRADPGTRERRLEKRREAGEAQRQAARDRSPGAGLEAGNDKELMGGGDSVEEYRQIKATERRRKSERQVKKEEYERARREIMDAKRVAWQQRERGTVSMLQELAKQRFGP